MFNRFTNAMSWVEKQSDPTRSVMFVAALMILFVLFDGRVLAYNDHPDNSRDYVPTLEIIDGENCLVYPEVYVKTICENGETRREFFTLVVIVESAPVVYDPIPTSVISEAYFEAFMLNPDKLVHEALAQLTEAIDSFISDEILEIYVANRHH